VIDVTELHVGDTLRTEDGERDWQLQAVNKTFKVVTRPADGQAEDGGVQRMRYPEATLLDKLESGDLERIESAGGGESIDRKECPDCGRGGFKGLRGLRIHRASQHPEEPEPPSDFADADSP
jgi:hypothetical protein